MRRLIAVGLALALIGFFAWVYGGVYHSLFEPWFYSVGLDSGGVRLLSLLKAMSYGGLVLMCAAPVVFWIVLPALKLIRPRRQARGV